MDRVLMQAKDIPERAVIEAVQECTRRRGFATRWDVESKLSAYPAKVVFAKLRAMVRRRRLEAECVCGCRGMFRVVR